MALEITVKASHPDDVEDGDSKFYAWHQTHSITRAYYWQGKGDTATAAAQDCLNRINESRVKINPAAEDLVLLSVTDTVATADLKTN